MGAGPLSEHEESEAKTPPPNYLRQWRSRAGLSQARVEKALGWHHATVSHLENNTARITNVILQKLAPLYGCQPGDLLRPVSREEMREVFGFRRPQRKKPDPAADPIEATLAHLMTELIRVRGELRTTKEECAARLNAQDKQIAAMIRTTAKAIKNTSQTTERIGRGLAILNDAINQVADPGPEAADDEPPID